MQSAWDAALSGDIDESVKNIEEVFYYIENADTIIEFFRNMVMELDKFVKTRLLVKLADIDYRIKFGANPLHQINAFLSFVWLTSYIDTPERHLLHEEAFS